MRRPQPGALDPGAADDVVALTETSALLGPDIGPVNHRLQYFFCGNEHFPCPIGGNKYVAFGANGSFTFKALNGTHTCETGSFDGIDPAGNQLKNCYFANYEFRASEGSNPVSVTPGTEIAFGANGVFNFRRITSSTFVCDRSTFGNPLVNVPKACYQPMPGYNRVAGNGEQFSAGSGASVAYGNGGRFNFKIVSGSVSCSVGTFGDPASGVQKDCFLLQLNIPVAAEGQSFNLQSSSVVSYTSGLDGNVLIKSGVTSDTCSSSNYGGDPDLGTVKQCYASILP